MNFHNFDIGSDSESDSNSESYQECEYDLANESEFYNSVSDYKNLSPKDTKKFINYIQEWTYNNPVNNEHVQNIKKALIKHPHLTGVFSIIKLDNGTHHFIDGHHRARALKEIYKDNPEFQINITVHCYFSDTLDSEKTVELFNRLNNTKPFKPVIKYVEVTIDIIKKIKINFPKILRNTPVKSQYPYVHEPTLSSKIQDKLKSIGSDVSTSDILCKFLKYDEKIKLNLDEFIKIHRGFKNKSRFEKDIEKANKAACYLGVVSTDKLISEIFD